MDPISALLGLDVDLTDEKTRAMADSLRGRKRASDFFSVSTIDPIAKMAQTEGQDVLTSAQTAGGLRRAMAERAQQEEQNRLNREQQQTLQDERIAAQQQAALLADERAQQATLAEREYKAGLEREKQMNAPYTSYIDPETGAIVNARSQEGDMVQPNNFPADISGMIPYDDYKAPSKLATSYEAPKTRAERDAFEKGDTDALALRQLAAGWNEDFLPAPGTGPVKGGSIRNFMANYLPVLTDKNSEEAARWWKNYQRQAELVQRHEMFGSALTKSEQKAWEAANIDPNIANAETIRNALQTRSELAAKMAERQAFTAMKKGYDPEQIEANYGSTVDVPAMIADGGAGYLERLRKRQADDRAIQTGTDRASLPDLPIAPTGDYSDEEEQRYQELKARQAAGEL